MMRRRERDHVNVFIFQQLSDVGVAFNFSSRVGCLLQFLSQNGAVHIAQRDQPRAFHRAERFDMTFAATVETDDGAADVIVRADDRAT